MSRTQQLLILVRHGQSDANAEIEQGCDDLYYKVSGSDREVGLTALGALQAFDAGRRLTRLFPTFAPVKRIWLSPFRRIRETIEQIELALGLKPVHTEDERLCKRSYGLFWNLTYKGVQLLYPQEHAKFKEEGPLSYRPPGGENYHDLFGRVEDFIRNEIDHAEGTLLVGAHSAVILAFQRCLEGLPDEEVVSRYEATSLPNGHILIYVRHGPGLPWQPLESLDQLLA